MGRARPMGEPDWQPDTIVSAHQPTALERDIQQEESGIQEIGSRNHKGLSETRRMEFQGNYRPTSRSCQGRSQDLAAPIIPPVADSLAAYQYVRDASLHGVEA